MSRCQMTPDWDSFEQAEETSQSSLDPSSFFGCTPSPYGNQAFQEDHVSSQTASGSATSEQDSSPPLTEAVIAGSLKPPGNCTEDEWRTLQQVVRQECKVNMPRACVEGDSPDVLNDKAAGFERCIAARTELADTCFDGGDIGHQTQVDNLTNGLKNCDELRVPVPVPSEEPETSPSTDPDFMQRMATITGLSGAALIAYLVISEGSRLFPPRNLIPVP